MRKRFQIVFAIMLVAVLGGLAWWTLRRREPTYEDRPVTAWIKEGYWPNAQGSLEAAKKQKANQAVIAIGTNALPFYLDLLATHEDSRIKIQLCNLLVLHHLLDPDSVGKWQYSTGLSRWCGARGLGILGEAAAPAIPALTKLLDQGDEDQMGGVAYLLPAFGLAGIPPLTNRVANFHDQWRQTSVLALGFYARAQGPWETLQKPRTPEEIDSAAKIIVPVLITCLKDSDPQVRLAAAESLGAFAREPDVVVPALIEILEKEKIASWPSETFQFPPWQAMVRRRKLPCLSCCRYSRIQTRR